MTIIPTQAAQCQTLREYREFVLRQSQREVGGTTCQQAWLSMVELGHLPRPKSWPKLLKIYRLEQQENEFFRMVTNAAKLRELAKPMSETHPLLDAGRTGMLATISPVGMNPDLQQKIAGL